MDERFCAELKRNLALMDALLSRPVNPDMNLRRFRVFGRDAAVFFVDGMVSGESLQRFLLTPCILHRSDETPTDLANAVLDILPLSETDKTEDLHAAASQLMDGKAVLLVDGLTCALVFDIRAYVRRGISAPLTESVVNGPHEGFNESLRDNVTLLRRILRTPKLIGEAMTVGIEAPVGIEMMYLDGVADPACVKKMKARLHGVNADHVLSIGVLQQLIEDEPFSFLPQCCLTERPDRAASFLLEGQIVVVMEGSPQILAMPISIFHLFHTPDDTSMRWQTGSFLRLLRWIGALCTLLLPALFVSCVIYHPEVLPVTLLTAVMEAQTAVPLSIPAEMLLMLFMFNLIGEAATRVPGVVGSSLGTVSGLILGQAAVEARLIHPLLIIVVAVASLGSYAIPDYALSLAFRMGQLAFVAVSCVFGVYGMVLLASVCVVRICGMTSLDSPFAAPAAPKRRHNPDLYLRWPIWHQRLYTWLAAPSVHSRISGRMRRWEDEPNEKKRP